MAAWGGGLAKVYTPECFFSFVQYFVCSVIWMDSRPNAMTACVAVLWTNL